MAAVRQGTFASAANTAQSVTLVLPPGIVLIEWFAGAAATLTISDSTGYTAFTGTPTNNGEFVFDPTNPMFTPIGCDRNSATPIAINGNLRSRIVTIAAGSAGVGQTTSITVWSSDSGSAY